MHRSSASGRRAASIHRVLPHHGRLVLPSQWLQSSRLFDPMTILWAVQALLCGPYLPARTAPICEREAHLQCVETETWNPKRVLRLVEIEVRVSCVSCLTRVAKVRTRLTNPPRNDNESRSGTLTWQGRQGDLQRDMVYEGQTTTRIYTPTRQDVDGDDCQE